MSDPLRLTRSDHKKKKELEEARKSGTLPPEMDAEGNLINPHIPEFMSKAPWYLNQEGPGLKHQKAQAKQALEGLNAYYRRGEFAGQATKYRKGACKNCGALTHAEKDCVDRPRKVGAWKTNSDIKPDEKVLDELALGYAGKRDRWAGYDPAEHKRVVERYERAEAERRRVRAAERNAAFLAKQAEKAKAKEERAKARAERKAGGGEEGDASPSSASGSDSGGSDSDSDSDSDAGSSDASDDDVREKDNQEVAGQELKTFTTKAKMSVRNLRIREDKAKYLYNLDPNSAHYDPKTRAMRANPNPHIAPDEAVFAGDNFIRHTGEAPAVIASEAFAWDQYNKGADVHAQANPTQLALMKKQVEEETKGTTSKLKESLTDRYGGAGLVKKIPRELLLGQTEAFVEYSRDGRMVGGPEKAIPKSRYEEDVYPNNHKSVWGSWYDRSGRAWGYACCHQTFMNSYCTGEAGKAAFAASVVDGTRKALEAPGPAAAADSRPPTSAAADLYGEVLEPVLDDAKLKKAMKEAKKRSRTGGETDERKLKYNSLNTGAYNVTAEEIEAYKMTKSRADDPMAKFVEEEEEE